MKTFKCSCPGQPSLFFESHTCNACGRVVGITDEFESVQPFDLNEETNYFVIEGVSDRAFKKCKNFAQYNACNGMVDVKLTKEEAATEAEAKNTEDNEYCFACRFNEVVPNLNVEAHVPLWQKMENAKRRALYTLKALPLPLNNNEEDAETGLTFEFTVDRNVKDHFVSKLPHHPDVMTGHNNGNITINLAEADDVARSKTKAAMGENYRTLLGHFRHELGHYYFDRLIANNPYKHERCKAYFGDDELDYQEALDQYYSNGGAPVNWPENFISEYATMHPWEDWAETWAHYMHIIDTLETAQSYGLLFDKNRGTNQTLSDLNLPQDDADDDISASFNRILNSWMEFSVVLNALNRSMGLQDAYPFVLTEPVRKKLSFIHHAVHNKTLLLSETPFE